MALTYDHRVLQDANRRQANLLSVAMVHACIYKAVANYNSTVP